MLGKQCVEAFGEAGALKLAHREMDGDHRQRQPLV